MEPEQNNQQQDPQQITQQQAQAAQSQATGNPGQTLGIVSLVTGIMCLGVIGLITGIIGLVQSKRAGLKNPFAVAGIIISAITSILIIGLIALAFLGSNGLLKKCQELGPGVHQVGNTTYTCGSTTSNNSSYN